MIKFEIKKLEKNEYKNWNNFVDKSPQGTIFHKTFWLENVTDNFDIYVCTKNEELIGGMPFCMKKFLNYKYYGQPPLTPYGGIIFKPFQKIKKSSVLKDYLNVMNSFYTDLLKNVGFYNITFPPNFSFMLPFLMKKVNIGVFYTYILNLNFDINRIYENFQGSVRSNIRKAEKEGMDIIISNKLLDSYESSKYAYERSGGQMYHDKNIVTKLNNALLKNHNCATFIGLDKEGNNLGTSSIVWDNKRCYYILGGTTANVSYSTAYLIWSAINYAKNEINLSQFDFEGSWLPGIERFFRSFGGNAATFYYIKDGKNVHKLIYESLKTIENIKNNMF